jgi:hypothetical protein
VVDLPGTLGLLPLAGAGRRAPWHHRRSDRYVRRDDRLLSRALSGQPQAGWPPPR